MGVSVKDIGKTKQIAKHNIGLLGESKDMIQFSCDREIMKLKSSLKNFKTLAKVDLPKLKVIPRDYQLQGYYWLCFLESYNFSGILADDM
tara:strand:+ start:96 stop:365 length:270 start_codon:yes stop_codon:yes gene_type:complete